MSHHPSFARSLRAGAALLVAAGTVLLLPGAGLAAPAGAAAVTSDPAEAAAGWLAAQLVDGDHIVVEVDLNGDGQISDDERFPDYGLTADTVIALAAAGVGAESIAAATDYLEANIELYIGDADDSTPALDGEYYAGALAKALLLADVTGRDPGNFGGVDLLERLLATETPAGRFSDISEFGDFSNNIGQILAIVALERADERLVSPAAVAFLVDQQCRDGGPQDGNLPITADADACAAAAVSVDTTALAFSAFDALDAGPEITRAREFLVRVQQPDGGFADMGITNANSTGLAASALTLGEPGDEAPRAAVQWLLDHQATCSAPPELQGAVAFTDDADGTPVFDDRATRATAQAVLGLADVIVLDVTAEGAVADAPRLDCAGTPTPTPTPTLTPTATPTEPTSAPPTQPTATATPSQPGLPDTGTAVGPLLGIAVGSLVLGGGLILAGRRRSGAHR